ncbi:MAG: hypothetical protein WC602_05570, partial [archaeon]
LKAANSGQKVFIDYSDSNNSYSSSLSLNVSKSPLDFKARLASNSVSAGEKSRAFATLKNNSQSEITDVYYSLLVPDGIIAGKGNSLPSLLAGAQIKDAELEFEAQKEAQGSYPISVRVGFTDSSGQHVLQKQFSVSVGQKISIVLVVLIIAFVFVLGAFVFSGKRRRKEEPAKANVEEKPKAEAKPRKEKKPKKEKEKKK